MHNYNDIAWKVRSFIYLALIVCGCYLQLHGTECEVTENEEPRDEFWPPDMVPHPMPPWERPGDGKGGELA